MLQLKTILMLPVLMYFLTGCETMQAIPGHGGASTTVVDTVREQKEQTQEITDASGAISGTLESIDDHADTILNDIAMTPQTDNHTLDRIEDSTEAIKEDVDAAQREQIRIDEALEDLEQANTRVGAAIGQIENLEDLVAEYEQSDREVRREALENLHGFITLFFVIGFGMLVGGAFVAFWVNGRLGVVILAIGMLTVGFAAASQYYLEEIATIGLIVLIVGFLATAGVLAWMLIDGKRDKGAVKEIVELVEAMKNKLTHGERKEIFGPAGIASRLTSDITKKIIAQVKIKNGFKNSS